RGTGYNLYSDGMWDTEPYERLESQRVGWPSIFYTAEKEFAIAHNGTTGLSIASRTIGDGSWDEAELPTNSPAGLLWGRAAAGGEDENTIHVICVSTPVANNGEEYLGMDGALMYYRSQDAGETWDTQDFLIPGIDSTLFVGFSGDTYAIHARGNTVAFAVFNDFADTFVMISHDNGDTWEKTLLVDFPVDNYVVDDGLPEEGEDWNEDGVFAEYFNSDGAGAILVDNDEQVHVTYGEMYYMDMDLTDEVFSYFPGVNGLSYWQEGWEPLTRETIAFTYDLDENGQLDLDDIALYFVSIAGMPSMSVDADNNLYVTYAAAMENFSNGQNFRHIHAIYSNDGGESWNTETACDLTPDFDFDEYESVFGSQVPDVDQDIRLIYQRDFEPGLHVRGDE
ncbi:MAG: sialidase family protein, partial [Bacteroidota bacterium]